MGLWVSIFQIIKPWGLVKTILISKIESVCLCVWWCTHRQKDRGGSQTAVHHLLGPGWVCEVGTRAFPASPTTSRWCFPKQRAWQAPEAIRGWRDGLQNQCSSLPRFLNIVLGKWNTSLDRTWPLVSRSGPKLQGLHDPHHRRLWAAALTKSQDWEDMAFPCVSGLRREEQARQTSSLYKISKA